MISDRPLVKRAPGEPLGDILQRAGVDTHSEILVTGPAALPALLWFCRHDYRHVALVRGRAPANACDCVLAPATCDAAALTRLLDEGPRVRQGGVLIVMTPEAPAKEDPVHRLLEDHGFRVERCIQGAHRDLHVARRQAA
jgi:hypothetical protein